MEEIWRDLECRSQTGFMLTWSWIGTWIKSQLDGCDPYVLVVKTDGRVVGLTVINARISSISRGIWLKNLYVHRTGDEENDIVSIEYNKILSETGSERDVTQSVLAFLLEKSNLPKSLSNWQGINIGLITDTDLEHFSHPDLLNWYKAADHSFGVDLENIRNSGKSYIDQLSKNTRYQIRRSIRLYEKRGPIELHSAASVDEAIGFFRDAGQLHLRRWDNTKDDQLFIDSKFSKFHDLLIQTCLEEKQEIELIKITVAGQPIGYLYNYIYKDIVYFYLCAFDYEEDKHLKPGLVSHYLCIEKYLSEGKKYYDFMAGEGQYKKSMGSKADAMFSVYICRKSLKLRLAKQLRAAFQAVKEKITRDT